MKDKVAKSKVAHNIIQPCFDFTSKLVISCCASNVTLLVKKYFNLSAKRAAASFFSESVSVDSANEVSELNPSFFHLLNPEQF